MNYLEIAPVRFPAPTGRVVNMMPIVFGDPDTVPTDLHGYLPLIDLAGFEPGRLAYLTVTESVVAPGQTQRRPGVHTDGTSMHLFGGGGFGGGWGGGKPAPVPLPKPEPKPKTGIYMASTDGRCRVWNQHRMDVDAHGGCHPVGPSEMMRESTLYWMTDRTPHESLPSEARHYRQFYRLVSHEIGVWFAKHSTPNPLGVVTDAPIIGYDKFGGAS